MFKVIIITLFGKYLTEVIFMFDKLVTKLMCFKTKSKYLVFSEKRLLHVKLCLDQLEVVSSPKA